MMRPVGVALVAGVLLLAGCGPVALQPQAEPGALVGPSEPPAEPAMSPQGQTRPGPGDPNPDQASALQVPAQGGGTATPQASGTDPKAVSREPQTENIEHAEVVTPVQTSPVGLNTPASDKTSEPNKVAPAPAQANDEAGAVFREYAEILRTYVREDGLVDYGALRRRRLDLKPLLMTLSELDPNTCCKWSPQEKLAFWINTYNLKMLDIVTRNYPIQSSWWLRLTWPPDDLRHIQGIWTDHKLVVMDEEFTLAEVEQRFFRKTFGDPRVYLALTYACQSSPILGREPYRGDNLDRQLNAQVRQFLFSLRGLQIDRRSMVVRLSALFKPAWRGKEFVSRYGTDKKFKACDPETRAVLNFISGYLSREDAYFLEAENYAVEYMNFDWRLNDTARGY